MNYAQIRQYDVANGSGIRTTLFVSGCNFNCKNCFNKEYQDFNYGNLWTKEVEYYFISLAKDQNIDGVSILGGEPMMQDDSIYDLVKRVKDEVNKSIWLWTGYTFECIPEDKIKILPYIDVLVDGQFIQDKHHHSLQFRGSSNQRLIDVQKTLRSNTVNLLKI